MISYCPYCHVIQSENIEFCHFCQKILYHADNLYEELNKRGIWTIFCTKEMQCTDACQTLTIGREDFYTKTFCGHYVSKQHVRIIECNGKVQITDLESTNGTYIVDEKTQDWKKIHPNKNILLESGSFIRLGLETICQVWIQWKPDRIESLPHQSGAEEKNIDEYNSYNLQNRNHQIIANIYIRNNEYFLKSLHDSQVYLNSQKILLAPLQMGDRIYLDTYDYEYWGNKLIPCTPLIPPKITLQNIDIPKRLKIDKLQFPLSQFTAILGASGAGKSTLLHILTKWLPVSSDSIQSTTDVLPAYVPQYDIVHEDLTIQDSLFYTSLLHDTKTPIAQIQERVQENLKRVHLEDKAHEIIKHLSGGQRKRVNIANVLIAQDTSYLILDEPTSGLDANQDYNIMQLLSQFSQQGRTIVITTHNLYNLSQTKYVVQLEQGEIKYTGTSSQLFAYHDIQMKNANKLYQSENYNQATTIHTKGSFFRVPWWILVQRLCKEKFSLQLQNIITHWLPFLLIPFGIGLLIHIALQDNEEVRLFLSSVSAFWLAMSLSSQELRKKRFKIFLHEKLANIRTHTFFIAYIVYYTCLNILQTFFLILPTFYHLYTKQTFNEQYILSSYPTFFLLTFLMGISGTICGLIASCIESIGLWKNKFKISTELSIAFLTIFQLIFSELLMGMPGTAIEYFILKWNSLRQILYHFTFSRYIDMAYKAYYNSQNQYDWQFFANIAVFSIWAILIPLVIFLFKLYGAKPDESYL
ncbi:MAG TPA: ATP-binding cassette domain-containing protein [Planctomycetota bacterium]|nr:ATP-binding cassette domain-containing protein [Planctomycetota bacterium]